MRQVSSAQSSSGAAEALGTEHKQARALSGAPVQCFGEVCVCAHGRARERVFAHVGERKRERGRTRSTQHSTAADIFLVIYEIFIFFCSYFFSLGSPASSTATTNQRRSRPPFNMLFQVYYAGVEDMLRAICGRHYIMSG